MPEESVGERQDLWLVRTPPRGLRQLKGLKDLLGLSMSLSELEELLARLPARLVEDVERAATDELLAGDVQMAGCLAYAPPGGAPGEGPDSVERFLEDLRVARTDLEPRLAALAATDPGVLPAILHAALDDPDLDGPVVHRALEGAAEADWWPSVIEHALDVADRDSYGLSDGILEVLCLRRVELFHPHLRRLFDLWIEELQEHYFRGAGEDAAALFREVLSESPRDEERLLRAWCGLLETRDPACWALAVENVGTLSFEDYGGNRTNAEHAESFYEEVGFELVEGEIHRLVPPVGYHLDFSGQDRSLRFGGEGSGECGGCRARRHHLLTLEPVPEGLGVSQGDRLVLEACLACLGWEQDALFYRHGPDGMPEDALPAPETPRSPRFPTAGLRESQVGLVPTPSIHRWQDWNAAGHEENLHRVGGDPTWIQGPGYLTCPECRRTMPFLLQLNSEIPDAEGRDWLWGSGGIAYISWCDPCRISGLLWQCT